MNAVLHVEELTTEP